jgi:hypothetical protein
VIVPFRCPVCEGRGSMPRGFYDRSTTVSSLEPEQCRACRGCGIVWASEHDVPALWFYPEHL